MYTYKEQIQKTSEVLDKIDFKSVYSHIEDEVIVLSDFMEIINHYCHLYLSDTINNDFFKGDIFNQMSQDDFKQYLINRYGKKVMLTDITYINF